MTGERRTCLIYQVDKYLCLVPTAKVMDHIILSYTQEDGIDQEGELARIKRASEQSSEGWGVKVEG